MGRTDRAASWAMERRRGGERRRAWRRAGSEAGFGLVEVAVAALLVTVLALGVAVTLDVAGATSASNQFRAVGATLAEQDQERLRAMSIADVAAIEANPSNEESRTVTVDGRDFTVVSRVEWRNDANGPVACLSDGSQANYLKISSEVRWNAQRISPVTVDSIVAPQLTEDQGNLGVQLLEPGDVPLPNVTVQVSGTSSATKTTNSVGCALFSYLPKGDYTITLAAPGYVSPTGENEVTRDVTVAGGSTVVEPFYYARSGQITATFDTVLPGGSTVEATSDALTVANTDLPQPGTLSFPDSPSSQLTSIATGELYPFEDGYAVYAGQCSGNDPRTVDEPATTVDLAPAGSESVTIRIPTFDLVVKHGGAPVEGASGLIRARSPCSGSWTFTTGPDGRPTEPMTLPYGRYDICASATIASETQKQWIGAWPWPGIKNDDTDGSKPAKDVNLGDPIWWVPYPC